ncbi:uncharacterized protein UV8b_06060 [Ustilaginoidea virens]|uniref:Uncharacterized protein n=1 Tax=Ustilaginoidea virens TaxID=1159556 RepID=A0A063C1L0_USTVR|nr:uncharacterized protein UV8b_06060 [Ustilaginoidea virens]QUC21819.1 hypothetical protein UV8b_06060 [Ustilaginoidea virens]GAO17615.1 hypothetical protein UVI_02050980 [Ustilaginoidea virens]
MADSRPAIALCSVGSLGKYLCDELLAHSRYSFVVISRQRNKDPFFADRNIDLRTSDYSVGSVLAILDDTNATALVSFNHSPGSTFVDVHRAFLEACRRSRSCKRFIPSEFAGNIDDFPQHPSYYTASRVPFREVLALETDVEWTIFNNGWLLDYFLTRDKTYMPAIPDEFPVDPNGWKACIRGSGNEPQSFSSGRDVARALVMLLDAPEWEPTTYITGQWATFNEMVARMEEFYGRPMPRTHRSEEDVRRDAVLPALPENAAVRELASVEEMMLNGSGACPREKTLRQRDKFFRGYVFLTLEDLLLQTGSIRGQGP